MFIVCCLRVNIILSNQAKIVTIVSMIFIMLEEETRSTAFSLQLPYVINSNLLFYYDYIQLHTHIHTFKQHRQEWVIVVHELYTCLGGIWTPSGTPCRPSVLHWASKRLLPNLFHPVPFSSSSPFFSLAPRHPLSSRDTITFCKNVFEPSLIKPCPLHSAVLRVPSPRET